MSAKAKPTEPLTDGPPCPGCRGPHDLRAFASFFDEKAALLAMDGASRSSGADGAAFVAAMIEKHRRNERRTWPSDAPPDAATHHVEE